MRNNISMIVKTSAVALVAIGGFVFSPLAGAATNTYTWTGAAGDKQLATAGNWAENKVPTDGAKLVFSCNTTSETFLTNTLTAKVSEIYTSSDGSGGSYCKGMFKIDKLNFQSNAIFSGEAVDAGKPYVTIAEPFGLINLTADYSSVVITNKLDLTDVSVSHDGCTATFSRSIKSAKNAIVGAGVSNYLDGFGNVTVKKDGVAAIARGQSATISNNIVFEDGAKAGWGISCMGGGVGGGASDVTVTLSGDIVLNGNVEYTLPSYQTLKITGNLSGSGKFVASADNKGTLAIDAKNNTSGTGNGTTDSAKEETIQIEGGKPEDYVVIARKQTGVLSGTRYNVGVDEGGILKGNGTVRYLGVSGVVAPGNSPGKITILEYLHFSKTGVYQAEILNKDKYDQLIVNGDGVYNENSKPVVITEGASLELNFLAGGVVKKGEAYVLIDNKSDQPIDGAFTGLTEGAKIVIGDAVFTVSYKGGDGNDFTLTVLSDAVAPGAPNTGLAMLNVKSPAVVVIAAVASAVVLGGALKRSAARK